jgi:short chain dehydrogenase
MRTEQKPLISGFGPRTTAEEALAGRDLRGKVAIVTGGHAGLGLETTRVLANAGATVVIGSRDARKAQMAVAKMKNVEVGQLDLANPSSIDRFAHEFLNSNRALDLLINNAGIMATPLMRDDRGYEMQFATNHLGHFQLTARLWEALKKSCNARVVALSSFGHSRSGVDFNDPNFDQRPYDKWEAYGQSKSANSLFAVELDKRGREHMSNGPPTPQILIVGAGGHGLGISRSSYEYVIVTLEERRRTQIQPLSCEDQNFGWLFDFGCPLTNPCVVTDNSANTPNAGRNSQKIARVQAWSLRLFSGSPISEETFLPLRHPFVSRVPHHHAVFVTREH